jgi:hypothetical protein
MTKLAIVLVVYRATMAGFITYAVIRGLEYMFPDASNSGRVGMFAICLVGIFAGFVLNRLWEKFMTKQMNDGENK